MTAGQGDTRESVHLDNRTARRQDRRTSENQYIWITGQQDKQDSRTQGVIEEGHKGIRAADIKGIRAAEYQIRGSEQLRSSLTEAGA